MRTKTLALSAVLSAIGAVTAVASQNVVSINAVGYMNVVCPPGFTMISCQVSNAVNNQIGTLMNDAGGAVDNCTIFKWSNAGAGYNSDIGNSAFSSYANGWTYGGTLTLNPGEAAWFYNGNSATITNTFVGTVPQGTNNVSLPLGFSMVASPVPFSGDVVTNMGLTNVGVNDTVFVWVNNYPAVGGGYNTYNIDPFGSDSGYMGEWNPPGDPIAAVGQGFWYLNATTPYVWAQVFSINP